MQVSNLPVRIERGHLHVGNDTYPLRNAARISLRSFTVKPPPPSRWVVLLVVIGGIGALVTGYPLFRTEGIAGDGLVPFLASLGLLALGVVLLVKLRQKPQELTVLRVVSSGTPYKALVSDDKAGLTALKQQMIEAINDLGITYHTEFRSYDINADNYIGEVHPGGTGFVHQDS